MTHTSAAGTVVNSAYYGASNMIEEFMTAATDLFVTTRGGKPLLQFEDFNSNDAFPLLETYRDKFLTCAHAPRAGCESLRTRDAMDVTLRSVHA